MSRWKRHPGRVATGPACPRSWTAWSRRRTWCVYRCPESGVCACLSCTESVWSCECDSLGEGNTETGYLDRPTVTPSQQHSPICIFWVKFTRYVFSGLRRNSSVSTTIRWLQRVAMKWESWTCSKGTPISMSRWRRKSCWWRLLI